MDKGQQWKIDELTAQYQLEPTLQDVFVEGWLDCRVIQKFAEGIGAASVSVYEVDTVEISAAELAQAGLPDNTRSRVIWLAIQLAKELGQESTTVTCVADSDFDFVIGQQMTCGLLRFTDLTSMEMYFFTADVLDKALRLAIGIDKDISDLLASIEPTLRKLFAFRCSNVLLGWGMTWFEPWKCLKLESQEVAFDEAEFVQRYLNKNARLGQRDEFLTQVAEIPTRNLGITIRGHDAFEMLAWILRQNRTDAKFCEYKVLLALAVSCASAEYLMGFVLFQELEARFKSS